MRNAITDGNQKAVVERLRALGCSVELLHRVGAGCPDLLVGYSGVNILIEVKVAKGKVSDRQVKWHAQWRGQVAVAHGPDEAVRIIHSIIEATRG